MHYARFLINASRCARHSIYRICPIIRVCTIFYLSRVCDQVELEGKVKKNQIVILNKRMDNVLSCEKK